MIKAVLVDLLKLGAGERGVVEGNADINPLHTKRYIIPQVSAGDVSLIYRTYLPHGRKLVMQNIYNP